MDATGRTQTPAPQSPILWAMVLLCALIYAAACVWKFQNYLYDDIDLAIFAQAESQLLRGSLWSSIRGMAWPGDHASWNLFLIAPVFAVFRHPLVLPVVQSIVLALGAVAVHRIARREIRHEGAALMLAAAWLLQPALGHLALFEFHPEALSTTALLFAFLELRAARLGRCVIWCTLALLGKEDVALVVFTMGLYALTLARPGRWGFGVALAALAASALALNLLVLKPMFSSGGAEYGLMYREWGGSAAEIARNVVTQPLRVLGELQATAGDAFDTQLKRGYWLELLLPFGFASLASPLVLLIATPVWLEHFLSWRYPQHAILNQYTALVLPFVAASAALGIARLSKGPAKARAPWLAMVVLLAAAAGQVMYGPFRAEPRFWSQRVVPSARDASLDATRDRLLARIPATGGVVASSEFLSRLATRDDVHAAGHLLSGRHTFSTRLYPVPDGIEAVLVDVGRERGFTLINDGTSDRWQELLRRNELVPVDVASDLMLFLRDAEFTLLLVARDAPPETDALVSFVEGVDFLAARIEPGPVTAGAPVRFSTWWRRTGTPTLFLMTQFVVIDAGGAIVDDRVRFLGYTVAPPQAWERGTPMRETYRLMLPPGVAPGDYTLGMRVWAQGTPPAPAAVAGGALESSGGFIRIGEFTIEPHTAAP